MNRIYIVIKTAIIASLAFGLPFCMAIEPEDISTEYRASSEMTKQVTFCNNIDDLENLVDEGPEALESLKALAQNMSIYIDGTLIDRNEAISLPVKDNQVKVKIRCLRSNIRPLLLKQFGIFRHFLPYVVGEAEFKLHIPDEIETIEIIYSIIEQIERWQSSWPNYSLGLRSLLRNYTLQLTINE